MAKPVRRLRIRIDGDFHLRLKPPRREVWWLLIVIALLIAMRMAGAADTPIQLIF
jgi:hypothetical protein